MKILYVDQTGQLGGGELAILPWLREDAANAHVVLFEDGPFRPLLEEAGVPVEVFALDALKGVRRESGIGALLSTAPAFWRLRSRLRERAEGFDALYANSQKAFLLAAMAKRKGQPLVWHLRDILTADHFSGLMRKVAVGFGNRFATVVIVNSHATGDSFVAAGGDKSKVRVVHDGVSAAPFDAVDSVTVDSLRAEIGRGGKTLVGLFGRLSPWKGQEVLLEALSTLPEVHGVLVGGALFGEDAHAAKLKERASAPDLAGRVHFLGFRRDIPALMKAMDIVAHTSTAAEPFGLVIVEGMLAGRPVIATKAGGALEILAEGDGGMLVAPGSVEELRGAIRELLENPESAAAMAARGRRRAEEVFSLEALFKGISGVLHELGRDN
jgi:glycosyltransferase involved in cell wall biosynthesis